MRNNSKKFFTKDANSRIFGAKLRKQAQTYFFFSEDVLKYCYAIMDSLQPEASITTTFFKEECVL